MNTLKLQAYKGLTKQSHFAAIQAKKQVNRKDFFAALLSAWIIFVAFFGIYFCVSI